MAPGEETPPEAPPIADLYKIPAMKQLLRMSLHVCFIGLVSFMAVETRFDELEPASPAPDALWERMLGREGWSSIDGHEGGGLDSPTSDVICFVWNLALALDERFDQFDLFAASFPAGTLVGAPKVRAMEIIEEMESVGRGLYAGTAGYFGASGDMDQAITIRTLVFSGDEYSFQAGAGIVADSVPAREYQEVLAKSAILRRALEMAGEGL